MGGRIHAVTASAGTGKTTRIVSDIGIEVRTRPPEELVATTFTIKAADELIQRTRAALFADGQAEAAARLLGARFGTVNAVCGNIVAEHAIELGRSPTTEVISEENESRLFAVAADAAISMQASVMNGLADAFGYNDPWPPFSEAPDWRKTVRKVISLARANGVGPEGLLQSAERSVKGFLDLLPPAAPNGDALDRSLAEAVRDVLAALPAAASAKFQKHLPILQTVQDRFARGEKPSWPEWAKLTKVEGAPTKDGRAFIDLLDKVRAAAGRHPEHPRLRADCERFIGTLFTCASNSLSAYQDFKAQRGLLDFTDQEALALRVLNDASMAQVLSERIGRVFVDEFQDSSPLQIAVFTALADIVDGSTWVGDPKQAIFGFRGADSELTQAAFRGVAAQETSRPDVLSKSWRSRIGLIEFVNAAFSSAFERMGLSASEHEFSGTNRSDDAFAHPPLAYWPLTGKVLEQAQALAEGIRHALATGDEWMIVGRDQKARALKVGDIAILCRTNAEVARYAFALSRLGIPVAVERTGLARTPHVELALAAYRWVTDTSDRLALAELARFFADDPGSDAWLIAASDDQPVAALKAAVPVSADLDRLRGELLALTPAELLDAILALPGLIARVESWGDHAIRLDDLEALRGCARSYESECSGAGQPATPSGLLLALSGADPKRPRSLHGDAVQVMTYHTAKGLEWPLVVMTGLAAEPKPRLFEPTAEINGVLDWRKPLANRWIRFWPWPYGTSSCDALEANTTNCAVGQAKWERAVQEDTRLLYVGMTRARDYLVFAPPAKASPAWLKVLDPPDGGAHIVFPTDGDNLIEVGGRSFVARVAPLSAAGEETARNVRPTFVSGRAEVTTIRSPLYIRPSMHSEGATWEVTERITLGPRLAFTSDPDMRLLGEAVHAFLAADRTARERSQRLSLAQAILGRWGVHQLAPEDVVEASSRLYGHIGTAWPTARLRREAPVTARLGQQLVNGRVDLLVETPDGYVVIDHKSFPGSRDTWEERASEYGSQLGLYSRAIAAATGRPCEHLYIHMPVVGALLRVTARS